MDRGTKLKLYVFTHGQIVFLQQGELSVDT